jgi:TRAP-type C4-dicarboxylate transport system permease small subunit
MKDAELAPGQPVSDRAAPAPGGLLTRINAPLARAGMVLSVAGLLVIVAVVFYQVFGRYVLNSSPTWTENFALVLVLYVTLIGAAVGVRDAGHIGMESLVALASPSWRQRIELVIHALVALFGVVMAWQCALLAESVWDYRLPTLGISEGWRYVPAVAAGVLITMFSVEHLVALLRGEEVAPTWA